MSFSKAEEEQDDELKCNEIKLKKKCLCIAWMLIRHAYKILQDESWILKFLRMFYWHFLGEKKLHSLVNRIA